MRLHIHFDHKLIIDLQLSCNIFRKSIAVASFMGCLLTGF